MQDDNFIPILTTAQSVMPPKSLFQLGQRLIGKAGAYRITEELSEFVYLALYVFIMTTCSPSMLSSIQ
jgi:hypothetical protein